ncbi:MAG: hypothetical protein H6742_19830 [Alphaproteobacteria bacterium]|nr:hypothetical protein [Alphaproteobacteria bacterium]
MASPEIPSYRMTVELPVGFLDPKGTRQTAAEVRAVTGADELYIGMSREYTEHPNDMVYKMLLLGRCVTRLGDETIVTLSNVQQLHARDLQTLERAIYTLTYGSDALPDDESPGG